MGPSPRPGALASLGEGSLSSLLPVTVLPTRKVLSKGGWAPGRKGADSRLRWVVEAGFWGSSRPP